MLVSSHKRLPLLFQDNAFPKPSSSRQLPAHIIPILTPSAVPPPDSHTNPGLFISSAKGIHMFRKWKDREKTITTLCSFYYTQPTADQVYWKQKHGEICPKSQGSSLKKPSGLYSLLFTRNHSPNIFSGCTTSQNLERFSLTRHSQNRRNMAKNYKCWFCAHLHYNIRIICSASFLQ